MCLLDRSKVYRLGLSRLDRFRGPRWFTKMNDKRHEYAIEIKLD